MYVLFKTILILIVSGVLKTSKRSLTLTQLYELLTKYFRTIYKIMYRCDIIEDIIYTIISQIYDLLTINKLPKYISWFNYIK